MNFTRFAAVFATFGLLVPASLEAAPGLTGPALAALVSSESRPGAPTSEIIQVSPNGRTAVEKLTGEPARAHLRNLKARRGKGFLDADTRLRARGFRQTENVVVLRSVSLVAGRAIPRNGTALVEDTISTGDGELVFWSWDDGDDSTWEGSIYMCSYSPEADLLADAQLDISTGLNPEPIWEETIYHNVPRDPIYQETSFEALPGAPVQVACASDELIAGLVGGVPGQQVLLVGSNFGKMVKSWAGCTLGGC